MSQINAYDHGKIEAPKFEMSEESYKNRDDSFSKWKDKNLKDFYAKKEQDQKEKEQKWDELVKQIKIGDRFEYKDQKGLQHRGTVRYVGETEFAVGPWVGIEFDEPYGSNDGSQKGKEYFKCNEKYGKFVRPDAIKIGDFPVVDELEELDDDEI